MVTPSKEEATMSETFTKSMARNIYFGGSVFFFLVFLALTYHTEQTFPERSNESEMKESVVRGKAVWENNVMFIVFPNGFKPHSQLELTESDLRYVDDTTVNLAAFINVVPGIKSQEELADRAASMQRVIDKDADSSTYNQPINVPLRTYYRRK